MTDSPYQVMPPLADHEFEALKADISARGVQVPVEYDEAGNILDGHHRVQACIELGLLNWPRLVRHGMSEAEKRRHARRLNLDRRHLDRDQKRDLIEAELRENPSSSDRSIGQGLGVDHKTVGKVRDGLESTGEIPQLDERKGRDSRVRRITQFVPATPEEERGLKISAKELNHRQEATRRQARQDLAVTLSNASADLPSGRKYPVIYADPPWHRNQGVTSRSYENHYPTMAWADICAMGVKDLVLPDAWLFLWIPRAHAFAWHEAEFEATNVQTGEVAKVRGPMPLASAVALSWGFGDYSTAFVWTKTDEQHPDEGGGAIIVRDQDELLLMFKRGNGLPKPDKKFGSNHRERSRPLGHSTKPQFYRDMIATMAGDGIPCLELFARFDPDRPAPAAWDLWGNQAAASDSSSAEAPAQSVALSQAPDPVEIVIEKADTLDGKIAQTVVVDGVEFVRIVDDVDGADVEQNSELVDLAMVDDEAVENFPSQGCSAASTLSAVSAIVEMPSEYEALKALSDFCHPRRDEICDAVGDHYAELGFCCVQGGTGKWILRDAGRARLAELEAERPKAEPLPIAERDPLDLPDFLLRKRPQLELGLVVPPKVDVIDDHVQTRLPVDALELD